MLTLYARVTDILDDIAHWLTPTAARLLFAAVLFVYYWNSGLTKLGDGVFGFLFPSTGAYIQIFPKTVEALGYDTSQLGVFHWAVAVAGTWAEFILPVLIVLGLFTRLAALGMIGFVVVQSWVDVTGHGLGPKDVGAFFDGDPSSLILDQRAFWVFVLGYLVLRGAGPVSVDALLRQSSRAFTSAPQPR
ncbi:DoxX family protein [Dinoroseobacter sp. PD6]|uniref:DoxX family protein n=1 Tax=Dinoroseobacter sp. PD6 TaxID=3028384 RepID=UPI00237A6C3A|nr:DoxX family protein [Dinoroseobacter sp. PD6]MDD9718222.1 DoxX family protein [Dinoroseobacter sp. PD6]